MDLYRIILSPYGSHNYLYFHLAEKRFIEVGEDSANLFTAKQLEEDDRLYGFLKDKEYKIIMNTDKVNLVFRYASHK